MAYRSVFFQLLLLFLVGRNIADAFFVNSTLPMIATRNISCGFMVDFYALSPDLRNITGWNGILNMTLLSGNDFCLFEQINITLRNGTTVSTKLASALIGYNYLKQYVAGRCSSGQFWPSSTPIGYGTCTQLPYETYSLTLCICSTNNCNADYSTCVASVQATQSSPPPPLPSGVPELTNRISCYQGYQGSTYMDMFNGVGWLYNEYTPFNMSAARAYQSSHAVACLLNVNTQTGDWYQSALMYEEYSGILYVILSEKILNISSMYAESATSVSLQGTSYYYTNASLYWISNTFTQLTCFCTTNNCNQNSSTCAIGLNVSVSSTSNTPQATTGAPTAPGKSPPGKCFSGTSRVRREDGAIVMLRDASIGDRLLVSENNYSPVLTFFVHQQQGPSIDYLRVSTTESTLEITPSHLILMRRRDDTSPPKYLRAARLRPSDRIFSIQSGSNGTMQETEVIRIEQNIRRTDAFGPLTEAGTLVVDDMLVSCYAQYEHHSLIHLAMFPFRLWKTIKNQAVSSYDQTELHPYIHFWLNVSRFLDLLIHTI